MSRQNVYNLIILDESGSMDSIKRSIISSFNEVIQTAKTAQKDYPEQKHYMTFVTFSGERIKTHLYMKPVDEIAELDGEKYQPNNSTPLMDAIGMSCTKLHYDLPKDAKCAVLVTILTDGYENSSKEFTQGQINNMIMKLKEEDWTFTYIGADHDVEGIAMSISIENNISFSKSVEGVHYLLKREIDSRKDFYRAVHDNEDLKKRKYYADPDSSNE
ncbi:MAG: VWA domain-containing protein [Chloroflexota bacterium]